MTGETVDNFFEQTTGRDNKLVVGGSTETGTGQNLKTRMFTLPVGDVAAAGDVFLAPGVAGSIVRITNVVDGTVSVAPATLVFTIGATIMTGSTITIATAGAIGDIDEVKPTILNTIKKDDFIKVTKGAGSTGVANGVLTFEILLS